MTLEQYLEEYYERFGEGFPMYQLGRGNSEADVAKIVRRCLNEGKDAYELGLVDEDAIY